MTLIGMAVYDTVENGRTEFTKKTLLSLMHTVDRSKHRIIVVDNGSCEQTRNILEYYDSLERISLIVLKENIGTAGAINLAMRRRRPDEYFVKMDNDVVFHKVGWVDEMEDVMKRMPQIGVLGLKRKDVCESTYSINPDQKSKLIEVPHTAGEKWYVVESCKHVMGTCTMLSPFFISHIGYFYQMNGLYGFDDSLMCIRATKSGYLNCFMHGIEIDHIDPGGSEYTDWKAKYASEMIQKYAETEKAYLSGMMSVYYNPFE